PGWRLRLGVVVLAVILASPNWLTLAVAVGSGESSREGRRLLAAEADGFITATWGGVALGVVASVVVGAWRLAARRRRAQLRQLGEQLARQKDAETLGGEAQERDAAQTPRAVPPDDPQVHERWSCRLGSLPWGSGGGGETQSVRRALRRLRERGGSAGRV